MNVRMNDAPYSKIVSMIRERNTRVVFIDGRGGSGKSTFARKLAEQSPKYVYVNLDDFQVEGGDLFSPENIQKGFEIDFENRVFREKEIADLIKSDANKIYLLEGCFCFKNLWTITPDLLIWIDIAQERARKRLNDREKAERTEIDPAVIELSTKKYQESESKYIKEFMPMNRADVIIEA